MFRRQTKRTGLLLFFISVLIYFCEGKMMVGGSSEVKNADAEVQEIAEEVKAEFEKKSNQQFEEFTVISYRTQVVAGTNYFMKVKVGENSFVHLRVFRPLPHQNLLPELSAYQDKKSEADAIDYF